MLINEQHWQYLRDLRWEMLADTPIAYVESLADAKALPESEWRFRARRCAEPNSVGLAAVDENGRWIGTMSAYISDQGQVFLVGVYVTPSARGSGVADLLLDGIEAWVIANASSRVLTLGVHESNDRAQAFYRRRGYLPTGETEPYKLDPRQSEILMVRVLVAGTDDAPPGATGSGPSAHGHPGR
ncbi:GNAT family N-acetyltransferase [Nakamurella silvestris]|nr:GNAT family N-acetyltransferase [Nakamurella silvestris]